MANALMDAFARTRPVKVPKGKPYVLIRDGKIGGLALRVTSAGARSYVLRYRNRKGVRHSWTIGDVKDWPLAAARKEAQRLRRVVDEGGDPLEEREAAHAAATMGELCDRYLKEHVEARNAPSSRKLIGAYVKNWIRPALGKMKVADVRVADLERLHCKATAAGRSTTANRLIATVSKMMSLAIRWQMRADNPAKGVERNREHGRTRYLSPDELGRLMAALAADTDRTSANAIRLLLLTGARLGEVMNAEWKQFDLKAGAWVKPASYTRDRREHHVPLSAPALQLLARMAEAATPREPRLFPGANPTKTLRRLWERVRKAAAIEDVRVHDLRHSYASFLVKAGMPLPVIGHLLGHSAVATTARYAHLLKDPLREATERVGRVYEVAAASKPGGRSRAMW